MPQAARLNVLCFPVGMVALLVCGCEPVERKTSVEEPAQGFTAHVVKTESSIPEHLLRKVLTCYRDATAYQDAAVVRLAYHQRGVAQVDEAPLAVRFQAPDRLRLQAYTLDCAVQNGRLVAQVIDDFSNNLDNQFLLQTMPPGRISADAVYGDPLLTQLAGAGMAGRPPQLELLAGDDPLGDLLASGASLESLPASRIGNHDCLRLRIGSDAESATLWLDKASLIIRRLELPISIIPQVARDTNIKNPRLTIEFHNATFTAPPADSFTIKPRTESQGVSRFIPPPPQLPSELVGRQPSSFQLSVIQGRDQSWTTVTETGSDRPQTVLLWLARHEGSQAAALALQQVVRALPKTLVESTQFILVMAEQGEAMDVTLGRWNVQLPWALDPQAVGRDVFGIQQAPALCVLGPKGTLEWFQHPVAPGAIGALPQVLRDLDAGLQVGQLLQDEAAENWRLYRAALAEVRIANEGFR